MRFAFMTMLCFALTAAGAVPCLAQQKTGRFEELARRVPDSANAIVLLDVDQAIASPYGKKMQWQNKIESAFMSGLTVVGPGASQTVIAVQLDLDDMEPMWEAAVMRLRHEPDPESAAKLYMGDLEQLGSYTAIELPGGAYAVKYSTNVVGALAPANRQSAARWVRETDAHKGPSLSPYLTEAYKFANDLGTPMIVALDLEDVPSVDEVREALSASELLKDAKVNIDQLAQTVAGIRGVTLGITLADTPFGKLKVDFRDNVPLDPELAKSLLLAALEKRGAMLVELEDWKPAVNGKQVSLEGHLTPSGLRRLSSLFNKPPSMPSKQQVEENQQVQKDVDPAQQATYASQTFFKHITDLLDDLKQKPKRSKSHSWGQIGVWCKNYADKIDQLSTLNVDPELVEFAETTSTALRTVHSTLASGAANARQGELNTAMSYNTYSYGMTYGYSMWGGWSGWGGTYSVPNVKAYQHDRTRARTQARLGAATDARTLMANLDIAVADMRHKMTDKYKVQF